MRHHFVDAEAVQAAAARALEKARPASTGAGASNRVALTQFMNWLRKQPRAPHLLGSTAAAGLLGVQPPHISRLREQGRMPDPIEVDGSVDVYIREEVEELARELAEEREARAARRKAKATA